MVLRWAGEGDEGPLAGLAERLAGAGAVVEELEAMTRMARQTS
jgi:hypothetical protein